MRSECVRQLVYHRSPRISSQFQLLTGKLRNFEARTNFDMVPGVRTKKEKRTPFSSCNTFLRFPLHSTPPIPQLHRHHYPALHSYSKNLLKTTSTTGTMTAAVAKKNNLLLQKISRCWPFARSPCRRPCQSWPSAQQPLHSYWDGQNLRAIPGPGSVVVVVAVIMSCRRSIERFVKGQGGGDCLTPTGFLSMDTLG